MSLNHNKPIDREHKIAGPYVEHKDIGERPSDFLLRMKVLLETDVEATGQFPFPKLVNDVEMYLKTIPFMRFCRDKEELLVDDSTKQPLSEDGGHYHFQFMGGVLHGDYDGFTFVVGHVVDWKIGSKLYQQLSSLQYGSIIRVSGILDCVYDMKGTPTIPLFFCLEASEIKVVKVVKIMES